MKRRTSTIDVEIIAVAVGAVAPIAETPAEFETAPKPKIVLEAEPADEPVIAAEGPPFMRIAWLAGLEVAFMPAPFLARGMRGMGGGLATNSRFHAGGAAFVELAWKPIAAIEFYGGGGAHVQYIGGANRPSSIGVASLVNLGACFFATSSFSIGIDTERRGVASETFHTGLQILPEGAVLWTGGLHVLFHIR